MTTKLVRARALLLLVSGVMAGGLLLSQALSAPPGPAGPKPPPKKPPARGPRPASPKPPPPRSRVQRPGKTPPKPARYVRRPRYWHPHFAVAPPAKSWTAIGYPYYVGGTSYVITAPRTGTEAPVDQTAPPPAAGTISTGDEEFGETYAQILELTDLVHEWRTLNESPTLHERLSLLRESDPSREPLASIHRANQRFDEIVRSAAGRLALGESADDELDKAAQQLDRLTALADALPPGDAETKAAGQP